MSETHIRTVMVELDGYDETGSKGGNVVEIFDLSRTERTGDDANGGYAVPAALRKYVVNPDGTESQRETLKSEYKKIQLADDHADVDNVSIGWVLDSETGTTLRYPG
jgi:hypothetical protein|tara:strand:+ start:1517 stop:1837 length:321 start_codon:yes stop_codon:yes gene_type:complete